ASLATGFSNDKKSQQIADKAEDKLKNIYYNNNKTPEVEQIQDIVEETLIEEGMSKVAKKYILYREQKNKIRNTKRLFRDGIDSVNKYIDKLDWKVHENSNTGYSLQGLNQYIIDKIIGQYWMQEIYPEEIKQSHTNGDLHIHDLSNLSPYCCGWDMQDLMLSGFAGVSKKTESKPPKHFGTALLQIVNFFFTLQGEAAGAQALSNFDTYLAPFIYYDNLTYKEVKQRMQEFIFNVNVPTRVGWQVPFTNITMDFTVPDFLKDEPVIVAGETKDKTYGEFQHYLDMFNRAFAEVMMEGDLKGRMFPFPIPTYSITSDFDWDNEILDPVWEMTTKYGIPYFSNFINSDMKPEDARSMAILGNQNVIYKNASGRISINSIKNLVNRWINAGDNKPKYKMFMNGKFVDIIDMFEVPYEDTPTYIKLKLENGYTQNFSYDHKCAVVRDGEFLEVQSQNVLPGDKFLVSIEGFDNKDIGTYNAGKILGYYLGEGWINKHSNGEIVFAINIDREDIVNEIENFFIKMACEVKIKKINQKNIFEINVYGKQSVGFVNNYIRGNKATEKRLNSKLWNASLSFRKGIIDGLYETDGHKARKILFHTTNKGIIDDLITLANSVGKVLKYRINDKNTRYFKEDQSDLETFTSYELKFYDTNERFKLDGEDYMLVDIKEVEELKSQANKVYNFTVDTDRHLYELPNGIITHQCCRLRLDNRELRKRGGGLFGANPMTGSIGVVTLNMPRIGYLSNSQDEFIKRTLKLMDIAKESLLIKRKVVENLANKGLYPYTKFYLRSVKKRFDKYYSNHFNTIGIIGMNEACLNLFNKDMGNVESIEFAKAIMNKIKRRLEKYQQETNLLFNLEASPAEGTTYRLAKLDKEKFGSKIIVANEDRVKSKGADPYYTNSTHLPVGYTDDIFSALDLQDEVQQQYTGGTVFHGFLGESINNIESTKKLIKRIAENYQLPYYTITPTFSICPIHGYIPGEHQYCPKCEAED
ncbi:MAG: anaerobic ribonucleoside-triphosphate reductase, partial [Halanaerobiales bacterium]